MSTRQLMNTVARLQDEAPVENIALSGGEPLLREDLPRILRFLRRRGISPVVITNGRLLTPEKVRETGDAGAFEITLFSYRREVHDNLAGSRGAWAAAVDGMANLRQAGRDFVAVFVATRLNWQDLRKTAELAIALGAYGLMYNRVNFAAHNIGQGEKLLPEPDMIRANLETLDDLAVKYGLPVAVSVVIEPCAIDTRPYSHIHFGWCPLAGENAYFTIDPAGDIRVCNHSPVVLGNVRRGGFAEIYYHHPRVREFRETWPEECKDCDPELRKLCGGGCKAAAEQCYGSLSKVDPFVTWCRSRPGSQGRAAEPSGH